MKKKAAKIFNKNKQELIGTSGYDSIETETGIRRKKVIEKVIETKKSMELVDKERGRWWKAIFQPIFDNKGDVETAIKQWRKTLKINSRDREAVLNLAKVYNDLAWNALTSGRKQEAIKFWQRALKINPGNKASNYYLKKYGS